jgi:hypothetical protein
MQSSNTIVALRWRMIMKQDFVKYGNIDIDFPTASVGLFSIFHDLVDLFGVEYQSEAVSLLKEELKKYEELKPKPNIGHEADFTHIDSRSADTIFKVAEIINNLAVGEFKVQLSAAEKQEIYRHIKAWKRPPRQKWKIGDVFSIPLLDKSFSFGQVVGTHLTAKCPILALFEIKQEKGEVTFDQLIEARVLSVWNADDELLANHTFKVLFNEEILVSPDRVRNKDMSGGATMCKLANVYFGLEPYNVKYREDYYDYYFQPKIGRPKNVIWLNKEERNKYRLEHFGVNENNE